MTSVQVPWYNDINRMNNMFDPSGISGSRRTRSRSRARSQSGRRRMTGSRSGRSRSRTRALSNGTPRENRERPLSINMPIDSRLFRQSRSSPQKIPSNLFTNSHAPLSLQSNNLVNIDLMMKITEQQTEIDLLKDKIRSIENWMLTLNNELD